MMASTQFNELKNLIDNLEQANFKNNVIIAVLQKHQQSILGIIQFTEDDLNMTLYDTDLVECFHIADNP